MRRHRAHAKPHGVLGYLTQWGRSRRAEHVVFALVCSVGTPCALQAQGMLGTGETFGELSGSPGLMAALNTMNNNVLGAITSSGLCGFLGVIPRIAAALLVLLGIAKIVSAAAGGANGQAYRRAIIYVFAGAILYNPKTLPQLLGIHGGIFAKENIQGSSNLTLYGCMVNPP